LRLGKSCPRLFYVTENECRIGSSRPDNNKNNNHTVAVQRASNRVALRGGRLRIALLEDDPDQSELISLWLEDAEHSVVARASGIDFLNVVRRESFDLYLLDWLLPDVSGIDVLMKLRGELQDYTPTLVATVKDEERNIVRALEAGADDYLVKPVRRRELVARVNAACRRAAGGRPAGATHQAGPYKFDLDRKALTLNGKKVSLSDREFDLALFFFRNVGRAVSRAHILETIWDIDNAEVTTRTVDTHVSRLRKKLELGAANEWKLSAIYQHGYRLEQSGSDATD